MKNKHKSYGIDLLVICDHALFSQDKKLSIIGIFDRLFVKSVPANHAKMVIAASIVGKNDSDCTVSLEFISPSGKNLVGIKPIFMNVRLGANGKGNLISEIVGFPVSEVGEYKVRMLINGESLREIPLYVQQVISNEDVRKQPN